MGSDEESEAIRAVFGQGDAPSGSDGAGGGGDGAGGDGAGGDGGDAGGGDAGGGATPPEGPLAFREVPRPAGRVRLPDIAPAAWEHPTDRAALEALRRIPAFDRVVRLMLGALSERGLRHAFLANAVRVGPKQFPRVHAMLLECCETLDAPSVPELFVAQSPIVNAGAIGVDEPFIVLNSGALDLFNDAEQRFVIGHELGHVLSGHALYKTMTRIVLRFAFSRFPIPMANLALMGVVMALQEWDRKSELSADRAGMLCVQDRRVPCSNFMKLAGGHRTGEMSPEAFTEQAREYLETGDLRDQGLKLLNLSRASHPFPVLRLAELNTWIDSGAYHLMLSGNYPRRGDAPETRRPSERYAGEDTPDAEPGTSGESHPFEEFARAFGEARGTMWRHLRDLFGRGDGGGETPDGGRDAP